MTPFSSAAPEVTSLTRPPSASYQSLDDASAGRTSRERPRKSDGGTIVFSIGKLCLGMRPAATGARCTAHHFCVRDNAGQSPAAPFDQQGLRKSQQKCSVLPNAGRLRPSAAGRGSKFCGWKGSGTAVMTRAQQLGVIMGLCIVAALTDPAGQRPAAAEADPRRDVRRVPAHRAAGFRGFAGPGHRHRRSFARRVRPVALAERSDCRAGQSALGHGRGGNRLRYPVCRARSAVAAHGCS